MIQALFIALSVITATPEFSEAYKQDPGRVGINTYVYKYTPQKESRAPFGYRPFYVSHYGRHGSRSGWNGLRYDNVVFALEQAHGAGLLTASGDSLMNELYALREAHGVMNGRLTARGVREHRQIAHRMYKRFKRVFRGHKDINAFATNSQRCIVSMSSSIAELRACNPKLDILPDNGDRYQMIYSSDISKMARKRHKEIMDSIRTADIVPSDGLMSRVFTDTVAAAKIIDEGQLRSGIFEMARYMEAFDLPYNTLRFISPDHAYKEYQLIALDHYLNHCNSIPLGADRMARVELLINDVVDRADAAIAQGRKGHHAADLRYGHDWVVLALSSYLGFEGVGERYTAEECRTNWAGELYTPFAANVQIGFYRSCFGHKPILVKFLLNERETGIIGLKPYKGKYYRWDDVKEYLAKVTRFKLVDQLSSYSQGRNAKGSIVRESYQGMETWTKYMVSCQTSGFATIYNIEGVRPVKLGEFRLACHDKANHANALTVYPVLYDRDDPMPLIGVSHCSLEAQDGMKGQLYLERIAPDFRSSQTVKIISFDNSRKDFEYMQWAVDREESKLFAYGNTPKGNAHRIMSFDLPDIFGSEDKVITLKPADAEENYLIEDSYTMPAHVAQGLCIDGGKLYLPTGLGTGEEPSILYVWDLRGRKMVKELDLSHETIGELEDVSVRDGYLWLQSQRENGFIWKVDLTAI